MLPIRPTLLRAALVVALGLCAGCVPKQFEYDNVPNESTKVNQPPYTIEAPDVLLINAGNLVPLPPYRVGALDVLYIKVTAGEKEEILGKEPIDGMFAVSPEGKVDLGYTYGSVRVVDMPLEQAKKTIESHLLLKYKPPINVKVDLAQSNQALQQIRGEHLVCSDGTVGLGTYGSVNVDGLTVEMAKGAIEAHLAQFMVNPKISLAVSGYNSKVYYVITDLAGSGQRVYRLPLTGKETVLDSIAQVYGLTPVSSKDHIWVARPGPSGSECAMRVDWNGITQKGKTATNYQLTAGDRVYVMGAPLVTADTVLARILSPVERVLGITLLASSTVNSIAFPNPNSATGR